MIRQDKAAGQSAYTDKPEAGWDDLPELVPSGQAAALLGVKPGTLTRYHQGDRAILAPPVGTRGRSALYRREDLVAFRDRRRTPDTPDRRRDAEVAAMGGEMIALRQDVESLRREVAELRALVTRP